MLTIPDHIEVRKATGETVAFLSPSIDGLKDCFMERELNGACRLTLQLPLSSPKWEDLSDQNVIIAEGREFCLAGQGAIEVVRDGQKLWGKVAAQESWVLLGKQFATISNDPGSPLPPWGTVSIISGGTSAGGFPQGSAGSALTYLLQGTGWSVGTVDVAGTHDLETEMLSILANVSKVQEIWGGALVWDSLSRTLSLRDEQLWQPFTGFQIRYAKNLKHITKTEDRDIVTRLYPFGTDNLNIASVNDGKLYLEDFSFTADVLEGIFTDQSIDDAAALKAKALEHLTRVSRPRVNYRVGLVDLRSLPEYSHETFDVGDLVTIIDEDCLGDPDTVRVIRRRHNVFQPWVCELEVGDPVAKLAEMIADSNKQADYVRTILRPNGGIGNLLRGVINTFTTQINSASGHLVWNDSSLEAVEVDGEGQPTGKRVRLTPGGIGVSTDGGQTYSVAMTGDGILANKILVNELYALATSDGYTKLTADGLKVVDDLDMQRVIVGWWMDGLVKRFGLKVLAGDGSTVILDDQGIMQTWQEGRADNVDNGHPLELNIYLPPETRSIHKALLRFRLQNFRAYETGSSAGGGTSTTTSSGGGTSTTSGSGGGTTATSSYDGTAEVWSLGGSYGPEEAMSWENDHNHGIANGTALMKSPSGSVTFAASGGHSHGLKSHNHPHGHNVTVPNHSHSVTIENHNHELSLPSHSHGIVYGIYQGSIAQQVTVTINGVNRTVVLGGPFSADQTGLDISEYLTAGGWNTIALGSAYLGRVDATVFIMAKMGV